MKARICLVAICLSSLLSGCSIIMAAHEEKDLDLSSLKTGTPRAQVEKILTNALTEGGAGSGRVVTYQYFTGDERSLGRAAAYGVLDIATLGLAEIATTSVEALQGDKHLVTIVYDESNRLVSLREKVEKAPLDKPERILGIEKAQSDAPAVKPALYRTAVPAPKLPESSRASM